MLGSTTGEDIFNAIKQFFLTHDLDITKVTSMNTDGAPTMVGRHSGLAAHMRTVCPNIQTFHIYPHKIGKLLAI